MNIKEIKSNPNNPRIIKDEKFAKLKKSISEFPKMMELRPMVINSENIVLGGNMRLKALKELGYTDIPNEWIKRADELTEDETRRFIIADNVGFGEHDWEMLANEWDTQELEDWGLDGFPFGVADSEEFGTDFELPDGDKSPFQQITFSLADEQAEQIKNAVADIKLTEEYKYCETMGNENSNGNALYLIIMQWAEQKK
tara:strand:- start:1289 stop:1885 length:597 start_codon:yes stop_codon:yes gene_type:complete